MSIPDYHISRIVLDENMKRQFDEDPRDDRSRRHAHERPGIARTTRSLVATSIYRLARAIDPAPTAPSTTLRHTP